MAVTTLAAIGYGLAAVGAGVAAESISSDAHDAQVDFKNRENAAIQKNNDLIEEAKTKKKTAMDLENSIQKRDASLMSQKQRQARLKGRNSTILTSPLGLPEDATGKAPKTLLGA